MSALLRRASLRHLRRHPWQIGFSVLGITLGVAVVVSVGLASGSAQRAFDLSSEAVTGRATHALVGGPAGLDEEIYRRLRLEAGLRAAAPVVEDYVLLREPRRTLHLLGIDPLAEGPFRQYLEPGGGAEPSLAVLLTRPGACLLARDTAADLGLGPGDTFTVEAGGVGRQLLLAGVLAAGDRLSREALVDLVLMDVATAQETLASYGRLSRIDLILPPEASAPELWRRLRAAAGPEVEIARAASRSETAEQMTRAFRINLRALSLLALLCGAFLIFNTMTFSVVERRTLLGMMRALGVTRRQVFALVLGEAAVVGTLGSALGLLLGMVLGRGLVELVTRTVNDLYFVVSVRRLELDPATLLAGLGLGLGATLLATLPAAREATSAPPRAVLSRSEHESATRRAVPRAAAAALLLCGCGLLLLIGLPSLAASFAGLFAVLLGCALLTPLAIVLASALLKPLAGRLAGLQGRLAAGSLAAHLSRTGVALAALMMAVAVTVGIGVMVDSFRATVDRWLGFSLPADLYVSLAGAPGDRILDSRAGLDPSRVAAVARLPGVERVDRLLRVTVGSPFGRTRLIALDLDARGQGAFELAAGAPSAVWPALAAGVAVLVSEPYAFRHDLGVGATLPLATPSGERAFRVAGIFYDYASDEGVVMMPYDAYVAIWQDRRVTAASLFAAPGVDLERLATEVRRALGDERRVTVRSNRTIREQSLAVFDRTFVITGVLRLLAMLVAFVGVASALTALGLERSRELGVLRALGLTRRQLWGLTTVQTGLMGLLAGLLALPVGLAMAAMMIYFINRRSFGWTMPLEVSPVILGQALLLALAAALLAGVYPAWRMSRTSPAEALREE